MVTSPNGGEVQCGNSPIVRLDAGHIGLTQHDFEQTQRAMGPKLWRATNLYEVHVQIRVLYRSSWRFVFFFPDLGLFVY